MSAADFPVASDAWPGGLLLVPRPADIHSPPGGRARLFGFAVKEATGSASAEVDIYNGQAGTAGAVIPVTLNPGESTSEWWGPNGLEFNQGITVVIASGTVTGSVYIAQGE